MLPRVRNGEHGGECRRWVGAPYDDVERVPRPQDARELSVPPVRMEESRRARPRDAPEEDVEDSELMERVECVQRLEPRQIALDDAAGHQTMLSPLHVDRWCAVTAPVGVQHFAMPVRPYISGCSARVVADPDDLLVRRHGERDPRAMDVVLPEQVVTDDRPGWVDNRDGAHEWEPFVALDV